MARRLQDTTAPHDRLAEVFSSTVRAGVLEAMFERPEESFSLTDLSRHLKLAVSSVQHEVYKLDRLGIVYGRRDGNSRKYRLQMDDPMTQALRQMVRVGRTESTRLEAALRAVPGLDAAVIATGERPDAWILLLIGNVDLMAIADAHERVAAALGTDVTAVEAAWFTTDVWGAYRQEGHPMLRRLERMQIVTMVGDAL
jgi:DNA-binding transcriptional ArsR family regulator